MSEITVQEAYRVMQAKCGIEVGDKVEVLRLPTERDKGYGWTGRLGASRSAVGKKKRVETDMGNKGFALKDFSYDYPFFCLELVEKAKPELPANVSFTKDGLTVGGTFVSTDTIKRNLGL